MRRCRYSVYWYYPVVVMLQNYDRLDSDPDATLSIAFKKAIDETIEEFNQTQEGREAVKAVQMVNIKQTHKVEGVADALHISPRTVNYRIREFILAVGKKVHFS